MINLEKEGQITRKDKKSNLVKLGEPR